MFNEAQAFYLEEVLGVATSSLGRVQIPTSGHFEKILVWVPRARSAAEDELLNKVLASLNLPNFQICEFESFSDSPPQAEHVLRFSGGEVRRESSHWFLPSLSEMIDGPLVATKKKEAWSLLKEFMKVCQS